MENLILSPAALIIFAIILSVTLIIFAVKIVKTSGLNNKMLEKILERLIENKENKK